MCRTVMGKLPQWGSYLADLWHSSGDGSLYRVYDDWNWQFGGTTSPRFRLGR